MWKSMFYEPGHRKLSLSRIMLTILFIFILFFSIFHVINPQKFGELSDNVVNLFYSLLIYALGSKFVYVKSENFEVVIKKENKNADQSFDREC